MADNETTTDIIAEMRGADNKCQLATKDGTGCYHCPFGSAASNCVFDNYADRLDAAHKRELAVYVLAIAKLRGALVKCRDIALLWQVDEAAGVAGTTDKPHARSAAEAVIDIEFEINAALFATATAEKLSAVGDAAKLREALKHIKDRLPHMLQYMRVHWEDARAGGYFDELMLVIDAALSAPPRNCDLPFKVEGTIWNVADKAWRVFKRTHPDAYFDTPNLVRCIEWLFAPATEQEGESDEQK